MKIFRTVKEMQAFAGEQKKAGKVIGLVLTMGALHEGQLTLMRARQSGQNVRAAVRPHGSVRVPQSDPVRSERRL